MDGHTHSQRFEKVVLRSTLQDCHGIAPVPAQVLLNPPVIKSLWAPGTMSATYNDWFSCFKNSSRFAHNHETQSLQRKSIKLKWRAETHGEEATGVQGECQRRLDLAELRSSLRLRSGSRYNMTVRDDWGSGGQEWYDSQTQWNDSSVIAT